MSYSPLSLQHPVPTHLAFIPEPPSMPASPRGYQHFISSPRGYQHFISSPPPNQQYAARTQYHPPFPLILSPQLQHIPDFWGMNDTTAQFSMHLGQLLWGKANRLFDVLKHHFNVSNSYVMYKLQLLIFPWCHKPWTRKVRCTEAGHAVWQPPRDDINIMGLVTYILIAALQTGLQERSHPEILGASATRVLVVVLIDFLFVQCGCYLLNVQGMSQVVDLIAYGGYKFVGIIITLFVHLLNLGQTIYALVFVYAFAVNALFILHSLRLAVLPDSRVNIGTINLASRKHRITFLFLEAVLQVIYMGILVRVCTIPCRYNVSIPSIVEG
ncbi:YIF1-domain-containing protein [Suillus subluteus]|nr:YIF1-domain-containing protein [Suillus subluteus]